MPWRRLDSEGCSPGHHLVSCCVSAPLTELSTKDPHDIETLKADVALMRCALVAGAPHCMRSPASSYKCYGQSSSECCECARLLAQGAGGTAM